MQPPATDPPRRRSTKQHPSAPTKHEAAPRRTDEAAPRRADEARSSTLPRTDDSHPRPSGGGVPLPKRATKKEKQPINKGTPTHRHPSELAPKPPFSYIQLHKKGTFPPINHPPPAPSFVPPLPQKVSPLSVPPSVPPLPKITHSAQKHKQPHTPQKKTKTRPSESPEKHKNATRKPHHPHLPPHTSHTSQSNLHHNTKISRRESQNRLIERQTTRK